MIHKGAIVILALLGALFIGLSLGLLGSGGSILTLPMLILVLGRPEQLAFAESLAIVGVLATVGSLPYAAASTIDWQSVFFFGLPGMVGAYGGAAASYLISATLHLKLFALVMLIMAVMMLLPHSRCEHASSSAQPRWMNALGGLLIGCLSGCMGIGGGSLIVSALVLYHHLPMPIAVGTSLVIIAMNASIGFAKHLMALHALHQEVSGEVIVTVSAAGIAGSFLGALLSKVIPPLRLRQLFGLNALAMGLYILFAE